MKFNKYNYYDDKVTIGAVSNDNGNNNNSSSETIPIHSSSNVRRIWGQYDDGGDIAESMKVAGNIYITGAVADSEEEDNEDEEERDWTDTEEEEEEFNFDWDSDTDGGSLYVDNNINSKNSINGKEVYGATGYINYPNSTSTKSNIATLIKTNADNIATNQADIKDINIRVKNAEKDINKNANNIISISTRLSNAETQITINKSDIEKLRTLSSSANGLTIMDDKTLWDGITQTDSPNTGIVMSNDEGAILISPLSLSDSVNFEDDGVNAIFATFGDIAKCEFYYDTEEVRYYYIGRTNIFHLGYYNQGEKITINSIIAKEIDKTDNITATTTIIRYTLFRNGSAVAGGESPYINYNVNVSGDYSLQLSVNGDYKRGNSQEAKLEYRITANYSIPNKSTKAMITPTNMGYSFNNGGRFYIGEDATLIKYGNYGLKVNESGIYKCVNGVWSSLI